LLPIYTGGTALLAPMFRKLSRNLAVTSLVYFGVGPLPQGLATLFNALLKYTGFVGVYFGWLGFVEGSVYTLTLLMTSQFRQELTTLFGAKPGVSG